MKLEKLSETQVDCELTQNFNILHFRKILDFKNYLNLFYFIFLTLKFTFSQFLTNFPFRFYAHLLP